MLERLAVAEPERKIDLGRGDLVALTHQDLLAVVREGTRQLTRELLAASDTIRLTDLDDMPVTVDTRRFCQLMAPYICMN